MGGERQQRRQRRMKQRTSESLLSRESWRAEVNQLSSGSFQQSDMNDVSVDDSAGGSKRQRVLHSDEVLFTKEGRYQGSSDVKSHASASARKSKISPEEHSKGAAPHCGAAPGWIADHWRQGIFWMQVVEKSHPSFDRHRVGRLRILGL
ncbi:hypothetical protein THAOC_36888 [Thalassiosira oceanica]|uniref:Uncharacterized protein n=1 Tax=Thalassiosira oceanica TaxID=159749 RepID=K0RDE5_THAOC|nr:hypothetical protein THAOC_36888 [Thalassiosira oceanica]|eukprot:EJK44562.1 hypothetical protein THAOC_36888 [Thalassiosira oceanica]